MQAIDRYDSLFKFYGEANGVDWELLKAQARAESNMDPSAISPVGAKGLTQFMPLTWGEWAVGDDPFNPEHSIRAQARYMRWLLDRADNHADLALAAYNWGIGNIQRTFPGPSPYDPSLVPAETRDYVARIMRWLGKDGNLRVQEV